jgi:hypothetical protein
MQRRNPIQAVNLRRIAPNAPITVTGRAKDTGRGRDRAVSFRALDAMTARVAEDIASCGIGSGDGVLILHPMAIELYVFLIALFRLGAVGMFLDPSAGRKFIEHCISIYAPRAFFWQLEGADVAPLGATVVSDFTVILHLAVSCNTPHFDRRPWQLSKDDRRSRRFRPGTDHVYERQHGPAQGRTAYTRVSHCSTPRFAGESIPRPRLHRPSDVADFRVGQPGIGRDERASRCGHAFAWKD